MEGFGRRALLADLRDGKMVDPIKEFGQPNKFDRPPVLMVRAFDFAVETGKTYRYRVRLAFWVQGEILRETRNPKVAWSPERTYQRGHSPVSRTSIDRQAGAMQVRAGGQCDSRAGTDGRSPPRATTASDALSRLAWSETRCHERQAQ